MAKQYDKNLDRAYLEARDIKIVEHQPWQFSLFHRELEGKFVWYPERGTLMYEREMYKIFKVGEFWKTEDVYNKILEKVNEQKKANG